MTRLNININDTTAEELRLLKEEKGISVTELIRNAVSLYSFLEQEKREGRKIETVSSKGKDRKILTYV